MLCLCFNRLTEIHSMTSSRTVFSLLFASSLSLAWPAAQAQVPAPSQWGLGLGVGLDSKPYRDFDNDVKALPLLLFENRYVSFFGAALDLKLPSSGPLSFRLRARYANDGHEAKDSPYLRGMAERKGGVWVGGAVTWRGSVINASAEALAATGNAEGTRVKLELNRQFQAGAVTVTPRLALHWQDRKFVDYYYGVRASEVRAGRAAYAGDAATNVELGLRLGYAVAPRHTVFVDLSATGLGSAIKDSPLVDRSNQTSVKAGYLYSF